MKPAYTVDQDDRGHWHIYKADITDTNGVSWREAKKQLRSKYLELATRLRQLTEKEFNESGN